MKNKSLTPKQIKKQVETWLFNKLSYIEETIEKLPDDEYYDEWDLLREAVDDAHTLIYERELK